VIGYFSADGLTNGPRFPEHGYDGIAAIIHAQFLTDHKREHGLGSDKILGEYYKMVSTYSHRNLTVNSDKLPAFSGLAQRLHELLGGGFFPTLFAMTYCAYLCEHAESEHNHT
jgi:hypothetical protein